MKLKAQIQAEIAYAMKNRKNNAFSSAEQFYYMGIRDALEWVQGPRGENTHVDCSPAEPLDEGLNFDD